MRVYLDDSGTRHPDRAPGQLPAHGRDWFALGGIVVRDVDVAAVEARHAALCEKWSLTYPLHSSEIRSRTDSFRWLQRCTSEQFNSFMSDIGALVTSAELTTIACVIDRPGYNQRYSKYGRDRWLLCKTAFSIVVERAAKFARANNHRLRVYVEKADKGTDRMLRGYYEALRDKAHPFDGDSAAKYLPLTPDQLSETLYEFKTKEKKSPLMQIADLSLWPMCIGGYDRGNRAYAALHSAGTLIDCKLAPEDVPHSGIKYSCWDLVDESRKNQSPVSRPG